MATKTRKLVPYSVRRKHNRKRPASKLEKAVYAMLKAEKIPFTKEKQIGRCHVDVFIEPWAVVEIQGCYWHKHSLPPAQGRLDSGGSGRSSQRQ